eukprot:13667_5
MKMDLAGLSTIVPAESSSRRCVCPRTRMLLSMAPCFFVTRAAVRSCVCDFEAAAEPNPSPCIIYLAAAAASWRRNTCSCSCSAACCAALV